MSEEQTMLVTIKGTVTNAEQDARRFVAKKFPNTRITEVTNPGLRDDTGARVIAVTYVEE